MVLLRRIIGRRVEDLAAQLIANLPGVESGLHVGRSWSSGLSTSASVDCPYADSAAADQDECAKRAMGIEPAWPAWKIGQRSRF
jgi:hypothetical protein